MDMLESPRAVEKRLLQRQQLQQLVTVYHAALRNSHAFLDKDGNAHTIKLVDRNNQVIRGDKQTKQQPTRICKNQACRKEFVPNTKKQVFHDRDCQLRDQSKRRRNRYLAKRARALLPSSVPRNRPRPSLASLAKVAAKVRAPSKRSSVKRKKRK
jgi:hypothetical protein